MDVVSFIHEANWENLPKEVCRQARRCLLDTLGAGIGGSRTKLAGIIRNFAAAAFAGRGGYLWFDGREVSPPGAALRLKETHRLSPDSIRRIEVNTFDHGVRLNSRHPQSTEQA